MILKGFSSNFEFHEVFIKFRGLKGEIRKSEATEAKISGILVPCVSYPTLPIMQLSRVIT